MGEEKKIALPRDAEGKEIPLDTEVLYDKDGERINVSRYQYYPAVGSGYWNIKSVRNKFYQADKVHLTQPDSWEKLFDDLDRCIKGSSLCMYYSPSGDCSGCTIFGDKSERCDARALRTIRDRIRKLAAKEGE